MCYHKRVENDIRPTPTEGTEAQRDQIIEHLATLNAQVARQMNVRFVLRNGIIHGVGFMVGSTVLTATVVSVILHFFSDTVFADVIAWIARMGR